jgi:prepilin-type N-terminal cleavage/methylation domain-containing protein
MRTRLPDARSLAGFTLIEIAFAIAILALVMGSLVSVSDSTRKTYEQGVTSSLAQGAARRAMSRVASEFENGGLGTLLPAPIGVASSDIAFQVATGIDANTGLIMFGSSTRLRWVMESGELDNGLDDDGDGLIDEGSIVLTRNYLQPGEISVILARGITELLEGELPNGLDDNGNGFSDERGFCMTLQGSLLILRITSARRSAAGRLSLASIETAVRLKN